jgi:prophage maintenance system killer protein/transcriptional regulator CtsR
MNSSEIKIYQVEDGQTEIEVKLHDETVWLSQKQMAELFDKDSDTIGLHLKNIYKSGELQEAATTEESSVVQSEGKRKVKRKIRIYNLDAIISVGYRVNSKRGTQFRIWANKVLKEYLVKGFSLNEKRLKSQTKRLLELQQTVKIIGSVLDQKRLTGDEGEALLKLITDYAYALDLLDQYDYQKLEIPESNRKEAFRLSYDEAKCLIKKVKSVYDTTDLFGKEKDKSFESSISTIYQTHNGQDLYPSLEEKAAHLLYFITKNHSFIDGNKRIAAFIFLYFLDRNGILFDLSGRKIIDDNALVALTILIAVSDPEEKDTLIKVIVNLLSKNAP